MVSVSTFSTVGARDTVLVLRRHFWFAECYGAPCVPTTLPASFVTRKPLLMSSSTS